MRGVSRHRAVRLLARGMKNLGSNRPLVVSFEVTHSCTCDCHHCDKGGRIENEVLLPPKEYGRFAQELNPAVVQISGGEPLLRDDATEIVRAIREGNSLSYIILVTNASLLNEERYVELKRAGVDQFSISLDFPDERHDRFRRRPGLYCHLEELVPHLALSFGYGDIILNCAITSENLSCLIALAQRAHEWGVLISYSAYSPLRTNDPGYLISSPHDLRLLSATMEALTRLSNSQRIVVNSEFTLRKTYEFFRDGGVPRCTAGRRFLVVRPDGYLNRCSMYPEEIYPFPGAPLRRFPREHSCSQCWVAIRSYVDKPLFTLITDTLGLYLSRK